MLKNPRNSALKNEILKPSTFISSTSKFVTVSSHILFKQPVSFSNQLPTRRIFQNTPSRFMSKGWQKINRRKKFYSVSEDKLPTSYRHLYTKREKFISTTLTEEKDIFISTSRDSVVSDLNQREGVMSGWVVTLWSKLTAYQKLNWTIFLLLSGGGVSLGFMMQDMLNDKWRDDAIKLLQKRLTVLGEEPVNIPAEKEDSEQFAEHNSREREDKFEKKMETGMFEQHKEKEPKTSRRATKSHAMSEMFSSKQTFSNLERNEVESDEREQMLASKLRSICNEGILIPSEEMASSFEELGDIYCFDYKDYVKATALYQMVLNILAANQENPLDTVKKINSTAIFSTKGIIYCKLHLAELSLLRGIGATDTKFLSEEKFLDQIKINKNELEKIRVQAKKHLAEYFPENDTYTQNKDPDDLIESVHTIYSQIATGMKDYVGVLLEQCYEVLGRPPVNYAIIGLGSLAREEMTPYSDLEFAVLIKEDDAAGKYKQYFRNLTRLLHLKIIRLGETIIPSMAIESLNPYKSKAEQWVFFDSITKRGFAFDGAMPQACKIPLGKHDERGNKIFELIQTPSEMAMFHSTTKEGNYWFETEPHLTSVLVNVTHIAGDPALTRCYQEITAEVLDQPYKPRELFTISMKENSAVKLPNNFQTIREYIARELIKEDYSNFYPRLNDYDHGRLFDAKKELYRIPNLAIDRLSLFYGLDRAINDSDTEGLSQSSFNKIDRLARLEYLCSDAAKHLKWLLAQTMLFRLQAYLKTDAQSDAMNALLNQFNVDQTNDSYSLDSSQLLLLKSIYRISIPLHEAMYQFTHGNTEALQNNVLNDTTVLTVGKIAARLYQFKEARELFEQALINDPKNIEVLSALGIMKLKEANNLDGVIDDFKKALEYAENRFGKDSPQLIEHYNNLAGAYYAIRSLDHCQEAIIYLDEAIAIIKSNATVDKNFIAATYAFKGHFLQEKGELHEARSCYEQSLAIAEILGKDNLMVSDCHNNLAIIFYRLGCYQDAIVEIKKAVEISKRNYGNLHHLVARHLSHQAHFMHGKGECDAARILAERAVFISRQLNRPVDLARDLNLLGQILRTLKQASSALHFYEEAWKLCERFEEKHTARLALLNNMGSAYIALAEECSDVPKANLYFEEARNKYAQCLDLTVKVLGHEYHQYVATSYNNLAKCCIKLGDNETAERQWLKAIEIDKHIYAKCDKVSLINPSDQLEDYPLHSELAFHYLNIGVFYLKYVKDEFKAKQFLKIAYEIYKPLLNQVDVMDILECLEALIKIDKNDKELKKIYLKDYYDICYSTWGESDERTQLSLKHLVELINTTESDLDKEEMTDTNTKKLSM